MAYGSGTFGMPLVKFMVSRDQQVSTNVSNYWFICTTFVFVGIVLWNMSCFSCTAYLKEYKNENIDIGAWMLGLDAEHIDE